MPSRRAYLASLSALAVAGCTARTQPGTSASTTPDRPDITVKDAAVQYSYRHIHQVDWNDVAVADGQFVFVVLDAPESTGAYLVDQFRLVADGEQYPPKQFERYAPYEPDVGGEQYDPGAEHGSSRAGWLCFETPATLAEQPTLRLDTDDGTWAWPVDAPKATQPAPEWEWTADAPDTVAPGERFPLEISAENVGDGPGTFRGAVNFSYPLYYPEGFEIPLDVGESGTTTVEASAEEARDGQAFVYRFVTAAGETKLSVAVAGEGETETTTSTATP